jgi:hypothetical protein
LARAPHRSTEDERDEATTGGHSSFSVVPIDGQEYKGRQWGWLIQADGHPFLEAVAGGTGACWNLSEVTEEPDAYPSRMHVCDLDELIAALVTLRNSEAHASLVERWA